MYKSVIRTQIRERESDRWAGERATGSEARTCGGLVEFPTSEQANPAFAPRTHGRAALSVYLPLQPWRTSSCHLSLIGRGGWKSVISRYDHMQEVSCHMLLEVS
jgi:hypothetical protein